MPVSKGVVETEIIPINQDPGLTKEEKDAVAEAEKTMKRYAAKQIYLIECPQCGTIHKGKHLAGLIKCNGWIKDHKGHYKPCPWTRPQTEEEYHAQEVEIQRQIKRAFEGRSKKHDYLTLRQ